MKRICFLFLTLFIFMIPVKADLTSTQEEDLAIFATNFILEGNKRLDSQGYPLLAYMQGQARIDGYQSKLYKVKYDYNHINYVNANKWTFDCASYASFVYYHTFGLALTYGRLSTKDQYSGLTLHNPNSNPYQVSAFVEDADKGTHFYYIKKGITGSNIDFSNLKKGDLIIYVGHHIMVYVGDGKIAEATTSCISKTNLGLQVIPLVQKYSDTKLSIIRLKDKIISPTASANTKITWLDTNETVELVEHAPKASELPQISYDKPSFEWTKALELSFNLSAPNGLKSYSFSNNEDNWIDLSGTSYILKKSITENGTYYLKIKDVKGISKEETIIISTIDSEKPVIESLTAISKDNYAVITIKAKDEESGLADKPYSFDNGITWVKKSTYDADAEKEYVVQVKDKAGNTASLSITPKIQRKIEPSIGNILFGETTNKTRKVTIGVLNCQDCEIIIKNDGIAPVDSDSWIKLNNTSYVTYLEAGSYSIWLKDETGNLTTKSFKIEITKNTEFSFDFLLLAIIIVIVFIAFLLFKMRKNNNI